MTRWLKMLCAVLVTSYCGSTTAAAETTGSAVWSLPAIRVIDEAGKPIAGAQVAMVQRNNPMVCFRVKSADAGGEAVFTQDDYMWPGVKDVPAGEYEVLVLAKGKAPEISFWKIPTDNPLTVTPVGGVPVKVQLKALENVPVPNDMTPLFYPRNFGCTMWPNRHVGEKIQSQWPKPLGNGQFEINLTQGTTAPLQMLVHHPGYLRAFERTIETTVALAQGSVKVALPAPGGAILKLEVPEKFAETAKEKTFGFGISTLVTLGGESQIYMSAAESTTRTGSADLQMEVNHLPPGEYWMSVSEDQGTTGPASHKSAAFNEGAGVEVKAGETTTAVVQYKEFDRSKLKGKFTAHVTVKRRDGSPAAGQDFEMRNIDRDFGWNIVTTGTLSDAGTTTIEGLAGGSKEAPLFRMYEGGDWGAKIGNIRMDTAETSRSFNFTLAAKPGEPAPDVAFTDVYSSKTVNLSDFSGKVVVLDFWATWCGPCQAPMEKNQKLLTKNAAAWADKVVIIGASVDDSTEAVRKHVKEKGWDKVRHLWCGGTFRDNIPSQTYGVDGVPTIFLIDQAGKLVEQTGDLESQVNSLL